ncbi:MAG: hypothetical protein VB859_03270, partial [Planctomycetaceae bacterium]
MSRLESLPPLVIAWAVALGFGGLLLLLSLAPDEVPEPIDHGQGARVAADADAQPGAVASTSEGPFGDPATDDEISGSTTAAAVSPPLEKAVSGQESGDPIATPPPPNPKAARKEDSRKATPAPAQPVAPSVSESPVQELPKPKPPRSADQIREALSQPVLRFSQEQPVSVRDLLREIEELAGVELRLGKGLASGPRLARKLKLDLGQTTVDGILGSVLKQVGLTHEVYDGYVLVTDATNGADG